MRRILGTVITFTLSMAAPPCARAEAPSLLILPHWTGAEGVSSRTFVLSDRKRREIFTPDPNDVRRLVVQVWYPTTETCEAHRFFPHELASIYSAEFGFVRGFEERLASEACINAPISRSARRIPVILFSHGLRQTRFSYTSILEDLASHGNLVIAIDHSYGSVGTSFPDGSLIRWNDHAWSPSGRAGLYPAAAHEYFRIWADDARFVLDTAIEGRPSFLPPDLRRRADFSRILYFGHSYGGMSALYAAQRDARIKGAANLDGGIANTLPIPIAADIPLLALHAPAAPDMPRYGPDVRAVRIAGLTHMSFSDFEWLTAHFSARSEERGSIRSASRGPALARDILRAFIGCVFHQRCEALNARLAEAAATKPDSADR